MSKKKRPNQKPAQPATPAPRPVMNGEAIMTMIREGASMLDELGARRRFDSEIGEYLASKQLVEDFESWRAAKNQPVATKPAND